MRTQLTGGFLIIAAIVVAACTAAQDPAAKDESPQTAVESTAEQSADEQAILSAAKQFEKAYNAHDAKAVAALFTPDAEIVGEDGNITHGGEAIAAVFTAIFEENPQAKAELAIDSIRFVAPTVAIEDGYTTVTHQPDEPADKSKYIVVHVKQDGKWLMASARDLPDELGASDEQLKQLSWLIGEWVDESPDAVVHTSYRWADNNRFILGQFEAKIGGRPAISGTQRIGWDPQTKKLRTWSFDSEGGFTQGVWTRDGDRWIIKQSGVNRDGKPASATNILTYISQDRASLQSRDRVVGDEVTDDVGEVILVRRPPAPSKL
jgi:uncharacterized protein (TIGR02246 family)